MLSSTRGKSFGPNATFDTREISDSLRILAQDTLPLDAPTNAGPKVVGLVSVETAWERSVQMFDHLPGGEEDDVRGYTILVVRLLDDPRMQDWFWRRNPNGFEVIFKAYWRWIRLQAGLPMSTGTERSGVDVVLDEVWKLLKW